MSEEEFDIIAAHDQMQAALENFSKLLGDYYTSLLGNGIPLELAHDLVVDVQKILFQESAGKK